MFFSSRNRIEISLDDMSVILGFDVRGILDVHPFSLPDYEPYAENSQSFEYAKACPAVAEQIELFNESFSARSIAYFPRLEPHPYYRPEQDLKGALTLPKNKVVTNAWRELDFGRPLRTSDLIETLQPDSESFLIGTMLLGTDRALSGCTQDDESITFSATKHVLDIVKPPSERETLLLERLMVEHWKRWRKACKHHGRPYRYIDGYELPCWIQRSSRKSPAIAYDHHKGFRAMLYGLWRLGHINAVIKSHAHPNVERASGDDWPNEVEENGKRPIVAGTSKITRIDGSPYA